jgi:hypothetical protein
MNRQLLAALLALGAALPGLTFAGKTTYCCTDAGGRKVCSDVLPPACYGRAYKEINERGITVRHVEAPLTAEQRAQKEAEARKAREEEQKRLEQERKDRALLATYASEQDIDYMRDRAVGDLEFAIRQAQAKYDEAVKRQKKLAAEAEFHKKGLPPALQAAIRDNEADMKAAQAAIEAKKKEIEAVRARYEAEKAHYRELRAAR